MIRKAQAEDYEAIKKIRSSLGIDRNKLDNREYRISLQENGFLLYPSLEKRQFEHYMQNMFLVYEYENDVIGYIVLVTKPEHEMEEGRNRLIWFRNDIESIYFSHPHASISVLAVSPTTKLKGVGTSLLQEVVKRVKERGEVSYVFSSVVSSPITNFPSMIFHEKMEFDRMAFAYYTDLFGLKNYQSILYGKKL